MGLLRVSFPGWLNFFHPTGTVNREVGMRGWRKGLITAGISALCLVFLLFGCAGGSKKDQDGGSVPEPQSRPEPAEPTMVAPEETASIPEEAESMTPAGPRDDGDPCREHRYQLRPGSLITLRFEKRLGNRPASEEVRFEVDRNHWADIGIDARVETSAVEAYSANLMLWVVDLSGSDLITESDGEPVRKLSVSTLDARGVTGVKWLRDGIFSVSGINGQRWAEQSLSAISESDMMEICEGELVFRYPDPESGRVFEFPLDRMELEREFFILTMDVELSLANEFSGRFAAREIWYRSNEVGRVTLRAAYNPLTASLVTISGPAFSPDCE